MRHASILAVLTLAAACAPGLDAGSTSSTGGAPPGTTGTGGAPTATTTATTGATGGAPACTDPAACATQGWSRALDLTSMTPPALDPAGRVLFAGRTAAGVLDLGEGPLPAPIDAFVACLDPAGNVAFAAPLDPGYQPSAVAVDAAANVFVVGAATPFTSGQPLPHFLRKLDPTGKTLWTTIVVGPPEPFDGFGGLSLRHLALRPDGSAVVAGQLRGTAQVDGVTFSSAYGDTMPTALVMAFGADGHLLWQRTPQEANNGSIAGALAVDPTGLVWVAGDSGGQKGSGFGISFDGCNGVGPATPITQVWLARFDGAGMCPLVDRFPGNAYQQAGTLAWAGGDVYLGGPLRAQDSVNLGAIDLGGGLLSATSGSAGYVGRRTATGAHVWSRLLPEGTAGRFAVDPSGRVVLPGTFAGTLSMFGEVQASAGDDDIYLARLGAEGVADVALRFGGAGKDGAIGAAVDATGAVFMNGTFTGAIDFGAGPLAAVAHGSDATDFFVVKLTLP